MALSIPLIQKKKDFTLIGKIATINIIETNVIYDGDTFRAQFSIYEKTPIEQFKIRIYGYDSPEMKPLLSKPNRALEIEKAHAAKSALASKIVGKEILILLGDFDKYGRPLGILFDKQYKQDINKLNELEIKKLFSGNIDNTLFNLSINHWMIENKHGNPYFGGTKL